MWTWLILFWMITPNLYAANPYKLGGVDYFHQKLSVEPVQVKEESFDWKDQTMTSNGQMTDYTPPAPVLKLLNDPSSENAKAYLDWQRQKVQKIIKAQEAIDQALKEENLK